LCPNVSVHGRTEERVFDRSGREYHGDRASRNVRRQASGVAVLYYLWKTMRFVAVGGAARVVEKGEWREDMRCCGKIEAGRESF